MTTLTSLTASQRKVFTAFLVVLLPISCFLIFILPWHMPVKGPIDSQSYVFGFSNATSHLGLALTLGALFLARLFIPSLNSSDRLLFRGLFISPARRSKGLLITLLAGITFTFFIVGGWWQLLPFGFFGESTYFLTRLDMMTMGRIPFRDFDYGYGPAMLWIPFLLSKVSLGLIKIDTAYILTVLLFFALGLLAMESILRRFGISDRARGVLLLFGTLASLNITLGVIYTPLRFIYPLWAICILHQSLRLSDARNGWMAAFALPFAGLMLGPEIGLVTCIGSLAGILWYMRAGEPQLASRSFAVVAALAACLGIFGAGYFKMIFFFGGGAYNFPIFPAPYILSILLVGCWVLPRLGAAGWAGDDNHAPLYISLLFSLGLFLPAVLGRCDPGHVICNGIGILVVGLGAVIYEGRRRWMIVIAVAALIVFTTNQIAFWNHYDGLIMNALSTRQAIKAHQAEISVAEWLVEDRLAKEPNHDRFTWAKRLPFSPDLLELLKYPSIAVPRSGSEDIDRFLKVSGRYYPEYFVPPFDGIFTPDTVAKKIDGLKNADVLLVPGSYFQNMQAADKDLYGKGWSAFLTGLFLFPVNCPAVNEPFLQDEIIARYISSNFQPIGSFRDYLILKHN
ncbi:MAG: hypothetical protein WAN16_05055 [Chthoniobacterales bacterium]